MWSDIDDFFIHMHCTFVGQKGYPGEYGNRGSPGFHGIEGNKGTQGEPGGLGPSGKRIIIMNNCV